MAERPHSDDRSAPGAPSSAWTRSQDTRAQVPRSAGAGFTPGTMLVGRDVVLGAAAGTTAALFFGRQAALGPLVAGGLIQ